MAAMSVAQANWKAIQRFNNSYLGQHVYSTSLTPGWINKTDQFWYSWRDASGIKFWRVDPKAKKKTPLFDSVRMAALLSEVSKKPYDTTNLPITTVTFDEKNDKLIRFVVEQVRYEYDAEKDTLKSLGRATGAEGSPPPTGGQGGGRGGFGGGQGGPRGGDFRNYSPDRKAYVYAQEHNLFLVEVVDGKDQPPIQLTKDGERDYSFGARQTQGQQQQQEQQQEQQEQQQQNQQQSRETRVRANVTWSKDSKRFYVTRFDSRKVKELFLVNSLTEPRPSLMTYRYAMPGEPDVTQTELFAYDPAKKELSKLPVERYKDQRISDIHWQDTTSDKLRFVRRDRLQRNLEFCEMDLTTSKAEVLLTESVNNAFLEVQSVRYVKPGGDFIWFSERTGWGHYYLYGNDGKLKHPLTSGPWRANNIVDVDADQGQMWVVGNGREPNENPYYRHLYRVGLDAKGLTLLDAGDADNTTTLSTTKKFAVNVRSRVDMAPEAVVRDDRGNVILELEKTDLSRLNETGWKMPETFRVKAADGINDIYGNMWKPFDFDPKKKYPIIANVYPGPQTESVSAGFSAVNTNQRLAQLGFIVIQIGNRGGNPARSNAYHSYGYFSLRDYGLADKKAGIEQLAARHPWIDIDKVGIYGHSGGGFMTAAALLVPPFNTFFKAGVSSAGNHDNNVYNANWSEQHHGLREVAVTATQTGGGANTGRTAPPEEFVPGYASIYVDDEDPQFSTGASATRFDIKVPTNHEMAANLKGRLLLVHGDMDNNVHPAGTIRLVNALIKANKRFDLMILPGQAHGFGTMSGYFNQMLMEHFARHLLNDPMPPSVDIDMGG
jgi:dipeptidyl aminopeptidase/acylaminoacyl peptidase